jgi:hypothetical protein
MEFSGSVPLTGVQGRLHAVCAYQFVVSLVYDEEMVTAAVKVVNVQAGLLFLVQKLLNEHIMPQPESFRELNGIIGSLDDKVLFVNVYGDFGRIIPYVVAG